MPTVQSDTQHDASSRSMQEVSNKSRGKKFLKAFGIYSIGIIGMRMIMFLMLPLYTYCIDNPSEYGYYDLCLALCLLLSPVFTLQMREVALRFLINNNSQDSRSATLTFIYRSLRLTVLAIVVTAAIIDLSSDLKFVWHTAFMLIALSCHDVISQATRGFGRSAVYVQGNILTTFLIASLNVLFLAFIGTGVKGIFWSYIIAHFTGLSYNLLRVQELRVYYNNNVDTTSLRRQIIKYSLPLVGVSAITWMISNSDRFLISYFLGLHDGGLYSVAMRFSMIIHAFSLILYQTWQESAISQFNSSDRNRFFSQIFNLYVIALSALFLCCVFILKMNYGWLVATNYQDSLLVLYPLCLSMVINALATAFYDPIYQSAFKTGQALPSLVITASLSLLLNILLIPILGVIIAAVVALSCNLILLLYRYFDTRNIVVIKVRLLTCLPLVIMAIGALPFYYSKSVIIDICFLLIALSIIAVSIPAEFRDSLLSVVRRKLHPNRN